MVHKCQGDLKFNRTAKWKGVHFSLTSNLQMIERLSKMYLQNPSVRGHFPSFVWYQKNISINLWSWFIKYLLPKGNSIHKIESALLQATATSAHWLLVLNMMQLVDIYNSSLMSSIHTCYSSWQPRARTFSSWLQKKNRSQPSKGRNSNSQNYFGPFYRNQW